MSERLEQIAEEIYKKVFNNYYYGGGTAHTDVLEILQLRLPELAVLAAAPTGREGLRGQETDTRTIQEVLQLHVESSESMRETFKRVGDKEGENVQIGITAGLKRAIEVADYRAAALANEIQPDVSAQLRGAWSLACSLVRGEDPWKDFAGKRLSAEDLVHPEALAEIREALKQRDEMLRAATTSSARKPLGAPDKIEWSDVAAQFLAKHEGKPGLFDLEQLLKDVREVASQFVRKQILEEAAQECERHAKFLHEEAHKGGDFSHLITRKAEAEYNAQRIRALAGGTGEQVPSQRR